MTDRSDSPPPSSLRTAGDSWGSNPLIRDEFARILVSPAGPAWARLVDPELAWLDGDQHGRRVHRLGVDYQAVRTHFFDEYFDDAVGAGIRQVVILAAGLDARAYRLSWPPETAVYEIDQPEVLEYKTAILESHGAVPSANRRTVPVDLRDDWPAALAAAGFDAGRPHGWLRACCPTCPATLKTGSSKGSPRSVRRAARSPSRRSA